MTTVLITGFGPFPGAPVNPSGVLARKLASNRHPAFAGVRRIAYVFETSYAAVDRELPTLVRAHRPDIILMFGLAARTPFVRIETRARNAVSVRSPDVRGKLRGGDLIDPNRCMSLNGHAPMAELLAAARARHADVRLSHDAGDYLCNYTYWCALEASRSGTLVQFVHIPLKSAGPAVASAGAAILRALLAAHRR